MLFVFQQRRNFEHYAETDRLMTDHFHVPARRIEAAELLAMEPALKPGLAGGWYYEHDAHLRPDVLLQSWRTRLEQRGVTVLELTITKVDANNPYLVFPVPDAVEKAAPGHSRRRPLSR